MLKSLTRSRHGTRWALIDFAVGAIAFYLGYTMSPYTEAADVKNIYVVCLLYGVTLLLSTRIINVPQIGKDYEASPYEIIVTSLLAAIAGCLGFLVLSTFIFYNVFGRYILVVSTFCAFIGIAGTRVLMQMLHKQVPLRVALAGCSERTFYNATELLEQRREIALAGLVDASQDFEPEGDLELWQSNDTDLYRKLVNKGIEIVVLCDRQIMDADGQNTILRLPLQGIDLITYGTFLETYFRRVVLDLATLEEVASLRLLPGNAPIFFSKRCLDMTLSSIALILVLPFLPFVALLIKLESRGPVFYGQVRDGYRAKPFTLCKFRTMYQNAEENGPQWASERDKRITRVGRLLRSTRLDEFPQFWNVLKGEMTLVGPRPERPEFTRDLVKRIPYYDYRYLLPPGITGWAQINYRYGESEEDAKRKLEYDLYYIRHLSLRLDFCILLKTVPLLMRGSR